MENKVPKKRKRNAEKPNKKWTEEEIHKILEYIEEENEFEKPTAQSYYNKFLEKTKLDADWSLVRWKVRHLKTSFTKAEQWRKSAGIGLLKTNEEKFKDKLKRMCPYYEKLKDIFEEKAFTSPYEIYDTECSNSLLSSENILSSPWNCSEDIYFQNAKICRNNASPVQRFVKKPKKFATENSLEQLTIIQAERNEIQKLKIELEKEKLSKEIEFNERKLQLEEIEIYEEIEKRKKEMDLRRLQMKKDEILRRLEIEKQERVQMYEIKMKYKETK